MFYFINLDLLFLNISLGGVSSPEFHRLVKDPEISENMFKTLYQEVLNVMSENEDYEYNEDHIMPYDEFRKIAPYMSFKLFKMLRKGELTFNQFRCRVFQDENNPEYITIDDLKYGLDSEYDSTFLK